MSQDNETIKRFKERVDNGLSVKLEQPHSIDELTPEQIAQTIGRGRKALEAIQYDAERNSVPPRPKIGNTDLKPVNDEITPVDWGLELDPSEVKQAIQEQENINTLDDLIIGTIRISPKTQLATYKWSAIASLLALILKVSGCV